MDYLLRLHTVHLFQVIVLMHIAESVRVGLQSVADHLVARFRNLTQSEIHELVICLHSAKCLHFKNYISNSNK